MNLRIAVDARPLSLPTTGIGRYSGEVLKRLVLSPHQWFLYSDRPLLDTVFDRANVHIRTGHTKHGLLSTPFAQLFFPLWTRQDQIDLFWSPRHHLPLLLPPGTHAVTTVHDLVWCEYPETMTRFGRLLESCLMPAAMRRSDAVICPSVATAKAVEARFALSSQALHTIALGANSPNQIGTDAGVRGFDDSAYMLFVGTLEPRKNLRRTLEAYAQAVEAGVSQHFYVVGSQGWGKEDPHELIKRLKIQHRVRVLGRVSDTELAGWYAGADFFLMPSLYEGFGLPLLEALCHGVPVITSNSSSMPEVAGDAGLLVNPGSVTDICAAIVRLANDKALREELSVKARVQAEKFSWEQTARQTLEIFESLCE